MNDTQVYLVDNGNDKDAGRKVRQILERGDWRLHAITNTHPNIGRIGGDRYLRQQAGCKVYAKGVEVAFIVYPELGPVFLYGDYPFVDLRRKFLIAPSSQVSDIDSLYKDEVLRKLGIIPLPGHFFQMVGVRIPDDALLPADCLSSHATLDKYRISFIYDVASYLETLDKTMTVGVTLLVSVYAEAIGSIRSLAECDKRCIHEIAAKLLRLRAAPQTLESVLKAVFDYHGLTMNFQQYVLASSTIRPYLAWLKDTGLLQAYVQDNRIIQPV